VQRAHLLEDAKVRAFDFTLSLDHVQGWRPASSCGGRCTEFGRLALQLRTPEFWRLQLACSHGGEDHHCDLGTYNLCQHFPSCHTFDMLTRGPSLSTWLKTQSPVRGMEMMSSILAVARCIRKSDHSSPRPIFIERNAVRRPCRCWSPMHMRHCPPSDTATQCIGESLLDIRKSVKPKP